MEDDRVYNKLEKIETHIASIDITLARNTDSLENHMARTLIIEKALFPIKRFWDFCTVLVQIIVFSGIVAAIIEGVVTLLSYRK